jgi:hypothetical protein
MCLPWQGKLDAKKNADSETRQTFKQGVTLKNYGKPENFI